MIYLDSAATTKPYPEVIETITNVLQDTWGNASSSYYFGRKSRGIIEHVRDMIAEDINCNPNEIIFTSGGCEANSMAIKGLLSGAGAYRYNFFTTKMEHPSIEESIKYIEHSNVCRIQNDIFGNIQPEYLYSELMNNSNRTIRVPFVSIAGANSEIGVIQDVKRLAKITHEFHGVFHCDMTALYPYQRIDVQELGIDMMTVSAQKFHATEGVGFLYVKNGIELNPIIYGTQENGLRGGSYNTALIAGMGKALAITRQRNDSEKIKNLRDKMAHELFCNVSGIKLNGPYLENNRLYNNLNITINDANAETLVTLCDLNNICISKGSACHSYTNVPSSTLKAIGLTDEDTMNTVRITLSHENTEEEIDYFINTFKLLVQRIQDED